MSAYFAVFSAQFRMLLQYRAKAWAAVGTQMFWGLIRIAIFTSFYQSSIRTQPISLPDTITYLWLVQALFSLTMWTADPAVCEKIRDGSIAYELLRPIDLYWFWYSRSVASRFATTSLRSIPLFAIAGLFFGMALPPSLGAFLLFLFGLVVAVLLIAASANLLTTVVLYTISSEGIMRLSLPLTLLFSGLLIPLPFFPEWFKPIVYFLPFRHILDTPIQFYTGRVSLEQSGGILLHAGVWILVLVMCGRILMHRATKRLVAQGG